MDISNIINTEFPLDVNVLAYLNKPSNYSKKLINKIINRLNFRIMY